MCGSIDVTAKAGIQETFVTVIAMLLGVAFTRVVGDGVVQINGAFIVLTAIHVITNYWAVKSLSLRTLNLERATILCRHFLEEGTILTPKQVSQKESVWFYSKGRHNFSIELAQRLFVVKYVIHVHFSHAILHKRVYSWKVYIL